MAKKQVTRTSGSPVRHMEADGIPNVASLFQIAVINPSTVLVLLALVLVTGCATAKKESEQLFSPPKPAFLDPDIKKDGKPVLEVYRDKYFFPALGPKGRAAVRDEFLFDATSEIDQKFTQFYREQYVGRTFTDLGFDLLNLGAGFAGTIMGGKFDKTVASALVVLFTGTKLSVQENLYNKQAVLAVMSKMESQRLLIGAQINSNRRGTSINGKLVNQDDYDLSMAVSDAKKYYDAGTIMGALVALNDTAATDKNVAQDTSQKVKEGMSFVQANDEAKLTRLGVTREGVFLSAVTVGVRDGAKRIRDKYEQLAEDVHKAGAPHDKAVEELSSALTQLGVEVPKDDDKKLQALKEQIEAAGFDLDKQAALKKALKL